MNNDPVVQHREAALAEVSALLQKGDADEIGLTAARRILQLFETYADRLCMRVTYTKFDVLLVLRCIARETQENLAAIIDLVEGGHAYAATALLRPMCEELIFARFIRSLPEHDAEEFINTKIVLEIDEGISRQRVFFSNQERRFSGRIFPARRPSDLHISETTASEIVSEIKRLKSALKDIGRRLGWGSRTSPSAAHMARSTNSTDEYEFLYHASSSSVHASLHHLGRMIWGDANSDEFSITNRNFEQYYRRFALTYGVWLCGDMIELLLKAFPNEWPKEHEDSYGIWLALVMVPTVEHRAPPIVTRHELSWKHREQGHATGAGSFEGL